MHRPRTTHRPDAIDRFVGRLAVAVAAIVAVLGLLAIAGCGDTSRTLKTEAGAPQAGAVETPTPSSATTTTTTPAATTTTVPDEIAKAPYSPEGRFRALMVRYGLPSEAALKAARSACHALDTGVDLETLALAVVEEVGYDKAEMAGRVIGAAVSSFCPQHQAQVDAFVAAH